MRLGPLGMLLWNCLNHPWNNWQCHNFVISNFVEESYKHLLLENYSHFKGYLSSILLDVGPMKFNFWMLTSFSWIHGFWIEIKKMFKLANVLTTLRCYHFQVKNLYYIITMENKWLHDFHLNWLTNANFKDFKKTTLSWLKKLNTLKS
jgi:hypothetical protein